MSDDVFLDIDPTLVWFPATVASVQWTTPINESRILSIGASATLTVNGAVNLNGTATYSVSFTGTGTFSPATTVYYCSGSNVTGITCVAGGPPPSEPTTQASAVNFTSVGDTQMTVNWTSGDGANRIVLVKEGSAVDAPPVDTTSYTADTAFGSGTEIVTGNYVVYNGTGSSVTVTGLTASTTYHVAVYEFNGSAGSEDYLTSTAPATGDQTTLTAEPATSATAVNFTSVTPTTMTVNWTDGNGANRVVLMKSGAAVDSDPADGTGYTADAAFGNGNEIGTGNFVIYNGSGSSVNVTGLSSGVTYHVAVYEYNGAGAGASYRTTTPATGSQIMPAGEPTTQASAVSFTALGTDTMTVNWTSGDGANRVVVMKSGSAVDAGPSDGGTYAADTVFGGGTQIGTGNYVVYNGNGGSVAVTGLTSGVTYHVAVYEFNGTGGAENYLTTSPATGSKAALSAEPGSQASGVGFASVTGTTMTVSWTNGGGANRIVLMKSGGAVDSDPADGNTYTANADFDDGDEIGTGNFVIYNGSGTSVNVTGLSSGVTYHVAVYELNGASGTENYLTTSPATGSQATPVTEPTIQASAVTFTSPGTAGLTVNWTNGNGANRLVVMKSGSAVTASPTDGTSYTANTAFGSGTEIVTGNYVVYNGNGDSVAVTGLTANTVYHVAVYEFSGTGGTENYLATSPATGSRSTLTNEPTTQASAFTSPSDTCTTLNLSWTIGNGTYRIVLVKKTAAVNSPPVDGTGYTANAAFGTGDEIGTGNFVVFAGAGSSVTVTGLDASTTYHFAVYEFNGASGTQNYMTGAPLTGSYTTPDPPNAPTVLTATTVSMSRIDLTWTDNSADETGFKVFRNSSPVTTTAANATSYSDTGLACGTTYTYEVKAVNADGDSSPASASGSTGFCGGVNGAPSGTSTNETETITFGPQITQYQYSIDGGAMSGVISSGTPLVLPGMTPGGHTLVLKVRDISGNWNTLTYTWTTSIYPIITTDGVSEVTQTSAAVAGTVTYNPTYLCTRQLPSSFQPEGCQSAIIARGVTWSDEKFPRPFLNETIEMGTDIGSFTARITGLEPGKTYYARAYVTYRVPGSIVPSAYSDYTDYGREFSFTTPTEQVTVDLSHAVMILKLLTGLDMTGVEIPEAADMNGDGVFGMDDVIAILQQVAEGN